MKPRRLIMLGLGIAALIFAVAITLNLLPGKGTVDQAHGTANAPQSSPTTAVANPSGQNPAALTPSAAAATAEANSPAGGAAPNAGGGPALTPDPAKPLEVTTHVPGATPLSLPTSQPQTPLVSAPLPQKADAAGALAAGYPEAALPQIDGSKIISSSVSPQESILQTSLVASTSSEPLAVQAFYLAHLAPLGFGSEAAPASAGSTATWFTRGSDKVTLTVTPNSGGASYIVYGVLHAGK